MSRRRSTRLAKTGGQMTVALGPHDRVVNVRNPDHFEYWQGKDGLHCLVCRDDVHVYEHSTGSRWVRHDRRTGKGKDHCTGGGGPETYEHEVLKFWVRDQLRDLDYEAECEPRLDGSVPDVHAVRGERTLAIEVQLQPLSTQEARRRTERLQARQCEVLWLTRHCNWVAQLPAVSLHSPHGARGHGDEADLAPSSYEVREGLLTCDPVRDGQLEGGRQPVPLDTFLHRFSKDGDVTWGWLRENQHGWALTEDWRRHAQWQQGRLDQLQHQLDDAQRARRDLIEQRREVVREKETLSVELARSQEDLAAERASAKTERQRLAALLEDRDRAVSAAAGWERRFSQLKDAVSGSFWGRRILKRLDEP